MFAANCSPMMQEALDSINFPTPQVSPFECSSSPSSPSSSSPSPSSSRLKLDDLPIELLGEIFHECALDAPDAPSLLSQVNRTFHHAAHSTPAVWCTLRIDATEGPDPRAAQKAELWFARCGTLAIDVVVDVRASSLPLQSGFAMAKAAPPRYGVVDVLRRHTARVGSLKVHAASECDARAFVNAVYATSEKPLAITAAASSSSSTSTSTTTATTNVIALESLVVEVENTAPPTRFASSIPVPHLPNLKNLKLRNHSIAFLAGRRFEQLQHLSITRPIRFAPFSLAAVLDILRCAPTLSTLSIESRIRDDAGPAANELTASDDSDGAAGMRHGALVQLPNLTALSLRTNVVPSFLSHLLLPNLAQLQLDDLNGKKAGRSWETGAALRRMLVRMELPTAVTPGAGLRRLDLVNVQVYGEGDARMGGVAEGEGVWEWCFARMKALEMLSIAKVDTSAVLAILASPPCAAAVRTPYEYCHHYGKQVELEVDVPCPNLHHVALLESSVPSNLDFFHATRPAVEVVFNLAHDPFSPAHPPGVVDYLSLYLDLHSSYNPLASPSSSSSSSFSSPMNSASLLSSPSSAASRPDVRIAGARWITPASSWSAFDQIRGRSSGSGYSVPGSVAGSAMHTPASSKPPSRSGSPHHHLPRFPRSGVWLPLGEERGESSSSSSSTFPSSS